MKQSNNTTIGQLNNEIMINLKSIFKFLDVVLRFAILVLKSFSILHFAFLILMVKPAFAGELSNQFTLELWVKPTGSAASKALLVKNNEIRLVTDASSQPLCQIYSSGAWQTAATSNTALSLDNWTHVACTYDKANLKVFVNGVQTGSQALTVSVNDASTNFRVGSDEGSTYSDLNGWVDNIQIYNYARTQKQIIEDMNAGHPAGGSPVGSQVAYWKLDEGYGTTGNDSSANSNSLTLSSASWTNDGKFGKAWNGDGANWLSRADDDDFDITNTDDFTVSGWFKSDSPTNPASVEYLVNKANATTAGWAVYVNTSGQLCFGIDDDTSWGPDVASCTSSDIYDGNWHSFIAVRNVTADNIYIYLDGELKDYDNDPTTATLANSLSLYLGDRDGTDNGDEFNGDLDEIKIYRLALTEDEIKQEYNRGKALVLGSLSDTSGLSGGTVAPNSASAEYCVPGDTSYCAPPVGEWKFDEGSGTTAYDTSGNGNNGTLTNGPVWTTGKIGKALRFDGSDDYINIPDSTSLDLTSFTVGLWIYPERTHSDWQTIIAKENNTGGNRNYGMFIKNNNSRQVHYSFQDSNCSTWRSYDSIGLLTLNSWNHILMTYDGSQFKFYLNGVLDSTQNITSGVCQNNEPIKIAIEISAYTPFMGKIDHVRIYNYARTPAQIAWDYNRGKPVAHWKFDECQGTTAYDSSGNSNYGTITIGASGSQTTAGTCTSSGAWYNGANGKYNSSLNFDGTDDYNATANVALIASNSQTYKDISFGGWFYPTTSIASKTLIHKNNEFRLTTNASGVPQCEIYSGSWQTAAVATSALSLSNWSNVLCTYDGSNIKIYVNGTLSGTQAETDNITSTSSTGVNIARDPAGSGYFSGQIDDVRIYNYALTQTQIKELYNAGAVRFGPTSGTP